MADSNPATLGAAAAGYAFNEQESRKVNTYLLARLVGDASAPDELARKAACYCFDQRTANSVITYLLLQIAGGAQAGGTCIVCVAGSGVPVDPATCPCSIAYNALGQFWFWDSLTASWFPISV